MSVEKILMPKLGESVTEGTIMTWLVKQGEHVTKYDPLVEVMTDKVNAEVPSSFTGTITEIVAKEGEVITVGDLICYIETEIDINQSSKEESTDDTVVEHESDSNQNKIEPSPQRDESMKQRYSPAVLQLASEHSIDLSQVEGTGLGGRITRKDIKLLIKTEKTQPEFSIEMENQEKLSVPSNVEDTEIPVTGVRKVIAQKMVKAKQEIPHAWMTVEADVTGLVRYRNQLKTAFKQDEGYALTYFSFFVYAVARALKEYPQLNSTWAGEKIIQRKDIHISIAVAKENELFVPVIKHADEKSVQGIAKSISNLAAKARNNELTNEDMSGGTFTINNTGTFGSVSSMGIINHPQAAILQVESIIKRPVIIDDMFAARDIVNLSLSLDHRILDGLICGRFLARVKEILESIDETSTIV